MTLALIVITIRAKVMIFFFLQGQCHQKTFYISLKKSHHTLKCRVNYIYIHHKNKNMNNKKKNCYEFSKKKGGFILDYYKVTKIEIGPFRPKPQIYIYIYHKIYLVKVPPTHCSGGGKILLFWWLQCVGTLMKFDGPSSLGIVFCAK